MTSGKDAVAAIAAPEFRALHGPDRILPGPGVTAERRLSEWLPSLSGGAGDTPVFVLAGEAPGGTAVVLGGTHGDEAAGYLAAVVLIEHVRARAGRLIVIPRANASGFTHNIGQEAHPSSFLIATPGGPRRFSYGARATNPVDQWPDPQVYTHAGSGQTLSGSETRNLNRAYPGLADGSLTERIAFAITSLIRGEGADIAIDLHEASPEYPVVNTIVAHERAMDLAAIAIVNLQAQGIAIGLEASPANLHGLSHREWGDATPTLALLVETTSPAQGRLRGRTDAALLVGGRDRFYVEASARGRLSVPFPETGWPLDVRVARHLATVRELLALKDSTGGLGHHEEVWFHIPSHHRLTHPMIGVDVGFIEAVVERVERERHTRAIGVDLLLNDHRNARLGKRKAMFIFVQEDALIKTGNERMQDRRFDAIHSDTESRFVSTCERGTFQIFLG